jgi:hypothetical protein
MMDDVRAWRAKAVRWYATSCAIIQAKSGGIGSF